MGGISLQESDEIINEWPRVSIITVVYNGEKHLEQTIQSVINQTYKNIEYIIIDGGSTDGTLDIIKKYKDHIDYWLSESDNGLYDAMNKGIGIAKGDLIGMINSDDWYESDAVKIIATTYRNHPEKNIFHADRYDIGEDGTRRIRKYNPSVLKLKYYDMTYNHPSMFVTKEEYSKHVYNTDLRVLSDYQFVLEAFLKDKNSFFYIDRAIVNYRLDGISTQIPILPALKEGFSARRIAGMSLFENIFAVLVRSNIPWLRYVKSNIGN